MKRERRNEYRREKEEKGKRVGREIEREIIMYFSVGQIGGFRSLMFPLVLEICRREEGITGNPERSVR
jgi:hypothetical protein